VFPKKIPFCPTSVTPQRLNFTFNIGKSNLRIAYKFQVSSETCDSRCLNTRFFIT